MRKSLLALLSVFLLGCSANTNTPEAEENIAATEDAAAEPADSTKPSEPAETEQPEEEVAVEETPQAEVERNERPVITHKYDTIVLVEGLGGLRDFSENVQSVVDPEDGELPYNNIGGFVGQQPDDFWHNITHNDNADAVATYGSGFYFSMGNSELNTSDGIHPITTFAYDSAGQLATKEYKIKYISRNDAFTGKVVTVMVEGLNVRTKPSISADIVGKCWPDAGYQVFEQTEADGYVWYRIGENMWIADNGEWLATN